MENGAVVGVKAEGEGKAYTIRAKAVILASGGYGANDALVPDEYKKFVYAGHAGATGDAIKMVEGLDADLINMDLVNTQPNSMILPSGLGQYCNPGVAGAYKAGAYMVNQNGERFFNESANAWDLMQAMKQNEAQYLIMDQTAFDNFNAGMTNSKIYTMEDVEKWLSDDYDGQPVMKQGATLAELCEKLNLPADAVEDSAKAFNDCAAAQTADTFGRTPAAAQSEEGPFYALQMHIRYYASLGGLHINDSMQVLNTKQEAIPGLYAAGECVGGIWGRFVSGGTGVMGPIVFGRLAARAAMANEPATGYTLKTPVAVITEDMFAKDADSAESLFDMSQTLADGEYEATVDGQEGPMTVKVTVADGKIAAVVVAENHETQAVASAALEKVPQAIVDANSVDVDGVSGATLTSGRIKDAAVKCLTQAAQ